MYSRDYLVRMIEQMTQSLGQLMGLKVERKEAQALLTINELWGKWFRLNSRLAGSLSEKDLIAMLSVNGNIEPVPLQMAGVLLKEEGDFYELQGQRDESYRRRLKSLQLLLAASENGAEKEPIDGGVHIGELLAALRRYQLPAEACERLWRHFEKEGQFAKAEDLLHEWLESAAAAGDRELASEAEKQGISFYERLLAMDDDDLQAGSLPREEVLEGLHALQGVK
ncbi:DUF6483 family protein [Paenibacillus sp. MBLB4367]|uniref:DUF6483 family protein n=1 Tax=Paenibacillus sp. MBLB4367 TaxID=3384767 RepID=UPI0039081F41